MVLHRIPEHQQKADHAKVQTLNVSLAVDLLIRMQWLSPSTKTSLPYKKKKNTCWQPGLVQLDSLKNGVRYACTLCHCAFLITFLKIPQHFQSVGGLWV